MLAIWLGYGAELKLCTRSCEKYLKSVSLSEKRKNWYGVRRGLSVSLSEKRDLVRLTQVSGTDKNLCCHSYTWYLLLQIYIEQVNISEVVKSCTMLLA